MHHSNAKLTKSNSEKRKQSMHEETNTISNEMILRRYSEIWESIPAKPKNNFYEISSKANTTNTTHYSDYNIS
jgi:hypothetical protein